MTAVWPQDAQRTTTDARIADVLVLGGGPAGAWAALTAAERGAKVVLAEKGFLGTGGATAAGNTTMIHAAPSSAEREAAIKRRLSHAHGLADRRWIERVIDESYARLNALADWGYPFPSDEHGQSYRGSLRGADYLRFMRRRLRRAGVEVLDQSPALELLVSDGVAAGASGINRLTEEHWSVKAAAVVVATGGCAFLSKALGTNGLTGDGLLLAAEAGALFSGMELTGQYGVAPSFASVTKGIMYFWATFTDKDGNEIERQGDRQSVVARNLLKGPVYAVIDKASPYLQEGMRRGQPNMFVAFDRNGIDPFKDRFEVTLRYEGTVRGVGGLAIDESCATTVPGLFAAGDAASRENMVGATSGGGGPNATWAMASGVWAGRGAAEFAGKVGPSHHRRMVSAAGGVGLRPAEKPDDTVTAASLITAVQQEILPIGHTFFRTDAGLRASFARLDSAWSEARGRLWAQHAPAAELVRAREAAAMVATARWLLASAIERRETRGLNRRLDFPQADPAQAHRLLSGGLDDVWVRPDVNTRAMAS
jgi:succinate dehydrogenase/fumarate reductase flavoprotein subunit